MREVGKSIRVWQLIELATLQWSFSWIVPSQQFKNEAIFAAVDRYWIVSVTPGGAWKMIEKVVILALVVDLNTDLLWCVHTPGLPLSLEMPGAMIIKAIFIINFFFFFFQFRQGIESVARHKKIDWLPEIMSTHLAIIYQAMNKHLEILNTHLHHPDFLSLLNDAKAW